MFDFVYNDKLTVSFTPFRIYCEFWGHDCLITGGPYWCCRSDDAIVRKNIRKQRWNRPICSFFSIVTVMRFDLLKHLIIYRVSSFIQYINSTVQCLCTKWSARYPTGVTQCSPTWLCIASTLKGAVGVSDRRNMFLAWHLLFNSEIFLESLKGLSIKPRHSLSGCVCWE